MRKNPKTIKILLIDGNPTGMKTAEIGNHVSKAVVIPRNRVKEASKRHELKSVGLYFLIGYDLEIDLPVIYIGEAENIIKRLKQHNIDTNKDFWNTAICFISKDDSLTKSHVKFLENHCFEKALKTQRCTLFNSTIPSKTNLPETDKADALDFFENLKMLIATLGYPIFDDLSESIEAKKIYYCTGPNANARGEYTDEGFVVFKDSVARKKYTKTAGSWVKNMRNSLQEKEIMKDNNKESLLFNSNYVFKSPSAAAACVLARRANGWLEWKDKKGNTLDKNERK